MSVAVLLQGTLERGPETQIDKNGKPYFTATVRVNTPKQQQYWAVLAFDEAAKAQLLHVDVGDQLCIQGMPQFSAYQQSNGIYRASLTVIADHIVSLFQPKSA
jgi:hypothetical protein